MLTADQLRAMALGRPNAENMNSVVVALNTYGRDAGLDKPHRLAHFLGQLLHESGSFRYDREIWGPTPAQKRYEGRKDLGNVQNGDGSKFRGRGPIQVTGRANYRAFSKWAKGIDPAAPNFEREPEKINADPWEGLSPIWYWSEGNPERLSLNRYADTNNIEMITRRINGGLNGYADRIKFYVRAALVLLGYGPTDVKRFQTDHPDAGIADGIAGEKTRMALHRALEGENPYREVETVEIDKPVVPEQVEKEVRKKSGLWQWLTGLFGSGALGLGWLTGMDWQAILAGGVVLIVVLLVLVALRSQIVAAVREIKGAVEGQG